MAGLCSVYKQCKLATSTKNLNATSKIIVHWTFHSWLAYRTVPTLNERLNSHWNKFHHIKLVIDEAILNISTALESRNITVPTMNENNIRTYVHKLSVIVINFSLKYFRQTYKLDNFMNCIFPGKYCHLFNYFCKRKHNIRRYISSVTKLQLGQKWQKFSSSLSNDIHFVIKWCNSRLSTMSMNSFILDKLYNKHAELYI